MSERIAIVGVGQTLHKSKRQDVNTAELCAEAAEVALADAQLTMKDVECIIIGSFEPADGYSGPDKWILPEL